MNSEVIVSETPNWLQALEEKREKRLKAKLGHETGAGAPCIKCKDSCPGLDLHFWRKTCKICRCPKEEHDIHDDDVYGWAQFQLLGSKPNKVKTKIALSGHRDEVELEWAPNGYKETIDKYLKSLPPESLPVKGSKAAQNRKILLKKQLPIHDIEPSLCHELNEIELQKMNEYIAHVKQSSVGVGQIANLSSIIKGNLGNIPPQEAAILVSRYPKGIPISEIVKLQCNAAKNLEKQLPFSNHSPTSRHDIPVLDNSITSLKIKDLNYPVYDNGPYVDNTKQQVEHFSKFDSLKTPSHFIPQDLVKSKSSNSVLNTTLPSTEYQSKNQEERGTMPNYTPNSQNIYSDIQSPTAPKNMRDLAFSTHSKCDEEISSVPYNFNNQIYLPKTVSSSVPYDINIGQKHTKSVPKEYAQNIPILHNESAIKTETVVSKNMSDTILKKDNDNVLQNQTLVKNHEFPLKNQNISESYLQPEQITIGKITDINYPEIKVPTLQTSDFFEEYSPECITEILNNVKLPDCHYCKKPFEENEFAITIDRAAILFHAQCFKCAGCNQILADNIYFFHKESNNIYCGRDYAKIRGIPRCKACDELIFTKEYCLAENSTFHLKHFCCIECDTPLAGQDYTSEQEMPYCLPCFEKSKASKCVSCLRVIKPDEIGCTLNGLHFHAVDECFACCTCKKALMGLLCTLVAKSQKIDNKISILYNQENETEEVPPANFSALHTIPEILDLEKRLENVDVFSDIVKLLSFIGGKETENTTRKILSHPKSQTKPAIKLDRAAGKRALCPIHYPKQLNL